MLKMFWHLKKSSMCPWMSSQPNETSNQLVHTYAACRMSVPVQHANTHKRLYKQRHTQPKTQTCTQEHTPAHPHTHTPTRTHARACAYLQTPHPPAEKKDCLLRLVVHTSSTAPLSHHGLTTGSDFATCCMAVTKSSNVGPGVLGRV